MDFHALRHTFVTNLARGGVHTKQAQDSARHCDIGLTMSRYSHTVVADRAAVLETLSDLSTRPDQERRRATGTDGEELGAGMCTSIWERRTSEASPLSLDGTETEPKQNDRSRVSTAESSMWHRMTRCGIEADDMWRSGRAAEGDGLENRYTGNRVGGSNPSSSV